MSDPFKVVRDFEAALCEYTGAPHCVTTTSCTMALQLAVAWSLLKRREEREKNWLDEARMLGLDEANRSMGLPYCVEIPKRTYIGVPMAIIHAGGRPTFRDEQWSGFYQLKPLPVIDSARYLTSDLYRIGGGGFVCISFHWAKTLGIQQGGAILHDDHEADKWLRKARFDGRTEGVAPKDDTFDVLGWHAYMSPETAAAGMVRLANLPKHNAPLPWDEYPDLSKLEIFR